ncbi:Alpha-N-arabinofuranosidase [Beutenbergia cavernae DSM 12333]|uniref:non-reducing end alpha-L-arabinofuranosidase n=1 Tax=Beutenbergia cavernae (strain ATCC BAA-8 / DSM 12333 / CCUG 43141 / JCM 11478 / NBRC 16432 / NCIMB 13614 / HKI 0122) TaxID=471853 RepID=C5BVM0_BEUC1|nr:alpha-N-arabinofuranosidase [Beutenbergia cavernae]ACQ78460.1 Alpha-N-arabinofuranosidase [Beutenbergia cavernae DSM 12333]
MVTARITVDRDFTVGLVPRRLFGSFVEHMGRCVYSGIYEPGHPTATPEGFRQDVLDLTRELGVTVVRYPGGNFVSGYDWEDGVGPVDQRPRRLDAAWHSVETNAFGLHEFVAWAGTADVEVMEAVNLGTRGVDEARRLVEYANHPGGTALSDLRRANGAEEPFGISLWCLGNEMDGPWQIGHKTAEEYGHLAVETAKAMRWVDPGLELVAVGSSGRGMPTFGDWERVVLRHAYSEVDYISLHAYYGESDGDAASYLASGVDMDRFIDGVVATVDAERARGKHRKVVNLSFDEWNVLHPPAGDDAPADVPADWPEHPPIAEHTYDVTDAVVVGTLLHSLLRHGDRVTVANQAILVNVLGPIRSEEGGPAWRQATFWPFARTAALARGAILRTAVTSERAETEKHGEVDVVDAAATWDAERGRVALFLANRDLAADAAVELVLRGLDVTRVVSAEVLAGPDGDRTVTNDVENPERVGLRPLDGVLADGDAVRVRLPPVSWAVVELEVTTA